MFHPTTGSISFNRSFYRYSRPNLARLALLVAADPSLDLTELITAAVSHPHYPIQFDAHDLATVYAIQSCVTTVQEFLLRLAEIEEEGESYAYVTEDRGLEQQQEVLHGSYPWEYPRMEAPCEEKAPAKHTPPYNA